MKANRRLASLVLALTSAGAANAQPVGPEFRVNSYTSFAQYNGAVTCDGNGNFVVGWSSGSYAPRGSPGGSRFGNLPHRYAPKGAPRRGGLRFGASYAP